MLLLLMVRGVRHEQNWREVPMRPLRPALECRDFLSRHEPILQGMLESGNDAPSRRSEDQATPKRARVSKKSDQVHGQVAAK
jgi:hypothetical protein